MVASVRECRVPVERARVVRFARANLFERAAEFRDKPITLGPAPRQDEHLGGVAVERSVVDDLRGDVARLEPEFAFGKQERNDDDGADVAELRGDGFTEQGFVASFSFVLFSAGFAPHDRVVGVLGSGDVDVRNGLVLRQVGTDVAIAADDPDKPGAHERSEHVVQDGREVLVDGAHLEDDDAAFDEQFVQRVHGGNARDVARAEDERDGAFGIAYLVKRGLLRAYVAFLRAFGETNVTGKTREQASVRATHRESLHVDVAVVFPHAAEGQSRCTSFGDVVEGSGERSDVIDDGHGAAEPLFTGESARRVDGLGQAAQGDHTRRGGDRSTEHFAQQARFVARGHAGKRACVVVEFGEGGVEFGRGRHFGHVGRRRLGARSRFDRGGAHRTSKLAGVWGVERQRRLENPKVEPGNGSSLDRHTGIARVPLSRVGAVRSRALK